ncbi:hypothetical protein [Vibrio scophthalmi]|uniref:Uncharacterized protein n=1 Tax=Vibrio scophthalmi LMG 19158 TaxID=870967 RepID=F9RNP5_9VIBR|nr:hypothetical protein [Vibrio scophthalmi]EGU37070.1 hypothetical protein VIS19158_18166 [Vibrio scophthalmi LMG 19158]
MKNVVSIQINTLDEALHLQNLATINIGKYEENPIVGQAHLQSSLVRMWRDVHKQAGEVVLAFLKEAETSECNM